MTHDHDLELRPTAAQTEAALNPPPGRNGGDLVVETLSGLGATTVFGLPGQHALGMFDALRRSDLRYIGLRVENNAGFAADAYGRITGEAAPLLLSTGPGALTSLAALQEARAASAPVLAISSQIPTPVWAAAGTAICTNSRTRRPRSGGGEVGPHGPHPVPDPVRRRSGLEVGPYGAPRPGVGGDPAGRAAGRDAAAGGDGGGRDPRRAASAPRTDRRGRRLAVEGRAPGDHRGRRSGTGGRRGQAEAAGGGVAGPGGHHPRRQGRVPLEARAVPAVLDRGPPHHGLPGGCGRPPRGGLGPGRTLLELPHVQAARPSRPDRGRPRQAGVEPPGAGHPRGRAPGVAGAAGDGAGAHGRLGARAGPCGPEEGRRPHRRPGTHPGTGRVGLGPQGASGRLPVLLGYDDLGLLGLVGVRRQGPQPPALGPGRRRPRLRLPGGPRRGRGGPDDPGARGVGRRRSAVLRRGVGDGPPVRPERHLAHRRRRRLRHPARVHDGRLRPGHGDGTDPPGLCGPRRVLRRPGVLTSPGRWRPTWRRRCRSRGPQWSYSRRCCGCSRRRIWTADRSDGRPSTRSLRPTPGGR